MAYSEYNIAFCAIFQTKDLNFNHSFSLSSIKKDFN